MKKTSLLAAAAVSAAAWMPLGASAQFQESPDPGSGRGTLCSPDFDPQAIAEQSMVAPCGVFGRFFQGPPKAVKRAVAGAYGQHGGGGGQGGGGQGGGGDAVR
jgi:hypothetical protein